MLVPSITATVKNARQSGEPIAALLMVAALPGRTHGLGLITERVLAWRKKLRPFIAEPA